MAERRDPRSPAARQEPDRRDLAAELNAAETRIAALEAQLADVETRRHNPDLAEVLTLRCVYALAQYDEPPDRENIYNIQRLVADGNHLLAMQQLLRVEEAYMGKPIAVGQPAGG